MRRFLLLLALLLIPATAMAQLGTVPYTFSPNTTIRSSEVNANLTYIHDNAVLRSGGVLTGTLTPRSMIPATPNTYDLGSASGTFRSLYLRTSAVLVGPSFNYNVSWANPAAERNISFEDPGGTDILVYKAATQTLSNKTIASPVFSGTSSGTYTFGGSATWAGNAIGATVGGTAQTSWTTGDFLYATASNTLGKRAIGTTGQVLTVSGGVPTWAGFNLQLLYENSGTDATAGAANVDTFALASTLTVKDTLLVVMEATLPTGTAAVQLYNSTDGVALSGSTNLGATPLTFYHLVDATTTTAVIGTRIHSATVAATNATFSTSYAGAWTIAYRHGGVSGGTVTWAWKIYKLAGQ